MSLQGTLRTLGISEVLEFLAERDASGRLDIEAESGVATYWMLDGQVAAVDFEFDRESGTDAAEATYYALAEMEGTFLFNEEEAPAPGAETESVPDVLGRTADTAEAWFTVEEVIPSPEHWLTRTELFDAPVTVQPEWWTAIDAIGSGCSSRTLTTSLGMRALESSLMATEMTSAGLLQIGEPKASSAYQHVAPTSSEADDVDLTDQPRAADSVDPTDSTYEISSDSGDDLPEFDAAQYEAYEVASGLDTEAAVRELELAVDELAAMSAETVEAHDEVPQAEGEVAPAEVAEAEADYSTSGAHAAEPSSSLFGGEPVADWPADESLVTAAPSIDWSAPVDPGPASAQDAFEVAPVADDGWASDHGSAILPGAFSQDGAGSLHPEPSYASGEIDPVEYEPDPEEVMTWKNTDAPAMPTIPEPVIPVGADVPPSPFDSDVTELSFPAPAPSGVFDSLPAVDDQGSELGHLPTPDPQTATIEALRDEMEEDDDESFGTEDRSSVLKFLRRDS